MYCALLIQDPSRGFTLHVVSSSEVRIHEYEDPTNDDLSCFLSTPLPEYIDTRPIKSMSLMRALHIARNNNLIDTDFLVDRFSYRKDEIFSESSFRHEFLRLNHAMCQRLVSWYYLCRRLPVIDFKLSSSVTWMMKKNLQYSAAYLDKMDKI